MKSCRKSKRFCEDDRMKKSGLIGRVIWYVYLVLLFVFVIVKFRGSFSELSDKIAATPFGTNYNLVPFRTIGVQIEHISQGWARNNLVANMVIFAPFGFLISLVYPKVNSFSKAFLCGCAVVALAEIFQFYTRLGSFDVDDIILNVTGVCIGYLGMKVFVRVIPGSGVCF